MNKRVCVIGAGAGGLPSIKTCLAEGLEPVCFERSDNIGGLWNYSDEVIEGKSSVMKNTYTNTSKEHLCYSDYPFPDDYPNYFHNKFMVDYFHSYAKKFDLMRYITFNTEVTRVTKHSSYDETGRWNVESKDLKNNTVKTEVFDGVLVCTGHHAYPNMPNFPGEKDFQGKILHSHAYKDQRGLEDKRILVVGIGNSGGDIAAELSHVSEQVYLSVRKGAWIQSKVAPGGLPWDVGITRRGELSAWWQGEKKINAMLEEGANTFINHDWYTLRPKHMLLGMHPTASEDLRTRFIDGSVKIKTNVRKIMKDSVEFDDGSVIKDIDAIIYATGYKIAFPCVDTEVLNVDDQNQVYLYKYVFPPHLSKPTLAVIGCIQPWGSVFPCAEMMGRVATRVIKGVCQLPSKEVMEKDIMARREWIAKRYNRSDRHTIEVGYITIMDELSEMIGCKPNLFKMFFTDRTLFHEVYYGPCTSTQYRLEGPGKWDGARDKILTQWERIFKPMKYRKLDSNGSSGSGWFSSISGVVALAGIAGGLLYYYKKP